MGFGFIIGGFCPGTSLVAASTLKIDGLIFVIGGLFGVTLFGETERFFRVFYEGSYFGRVTLMEFLNLPTGIVVTLVVLMALFMFWGGEQLEKIIGKKDLSKESNLRYVGAGGILAAALIVWGIGQPTTVDRWERLSVEKQADLDARMYYIHPGELLQTMHDPKINLIMLDVRSEGDYNLFHILDAEHLPPGEIPGMIDEFHLEPANTVFVLMSNDETTATEAWKVMVSEAVPNVYILSGGINHWLDTFAGEFEGDFCAGKKPNAGDDELRYDFTAALGAGCPAAYPDEEAFELEFEPKIQLELKRAPTGGGCG
jgi:rhodanese-related sulfurtransferase